MSWPPAHVRPLGIVTVHGLSQRRRGRVEARSAGQRSIFCAILPRSAFGSQAA